MRFSQLARIVKVLVEDCGMQQTLRALADVSFSNSESALRTKDFVGGLDANSWATLQVMLGDIADELVVPEYGVKVRLDG